MAKLISKTMVNFWLDCTLMVLFLALCWCAVIVQFVFPPGPDADGWVLWGWNYAQWSGFQFGVLSTLALGVLIHVMLHWTWVCGVVSTRFPGQRKKTAGKRNDALQTIYGVATLIVVFNLVGAAVAVAALTIHTPLP